MDGKNFPKPRKVRFPNGDVIYSSWYQHSWLGANGRIKKGATYKLSCEGTPIHHWQWTQYNAWKQRKGETK